MQTLSKMIKCEIVKLEQFSGSKASIYSVVLAGETQTLLDKFISENIILYKSETKNILERLIAIGHNVGARVNFFKEGEGNPGDGLCALYDNPNSKLRLYCIRYGSQIIIVGGGGEKPKNIRTLQESDKLKEENYLLRELSGQITNRIKEKEIQFSNDSLNFIGDLAFDEEY